MKNLILKRYGKVDIMNWCKLGFHDWIDGETQRTKNICYGWANLPGMRIKQKCKNCPETRHLRLNLCQPIKDLYREELWKNE